jgi:hypothetical protein
MRLLLASALAAVIASGCGPGGADPPSRGVRDGSKLPNVARIVCTAAGTRLLTPAVRPQSDGVHVMLSQTGGRPATLETDQGGGDKPGPKPLVLILPPGRAHLGCMTMADWNVDPPRHRGWVTLRVVDQDKQWVDDRPAGATCSQSSIDYTPTAAGLRLSQLGQDARRALDASPADAVERAGYRRQEPIEYRLVRDGKVVGSRHVHVNRSRALAARRRPEMRLSGAAGYASRSSAATSASVTQAAQRSVLQPDRSTSSR